VEALKYATEKVFDSAGAFPQSTELPDSLSQLFIENWSPLLDVAKLAWDTIITTTTRYVYYSIDPNDKLGPGGFGDGAYLPAEQSLAYQVRFENKSDASAPAQRIVVTDGIDDDLDLNTFELNEIRFSNQMLAVPPGLNHRETTVPMNANGTDIRAGMPLGGTRPVPLPRLRAGTCRGCIGGAGRPK
jgi:hypothetical protein